MKTVDEAGMVASWKDAFLTKSSNVTKTSASTAIVHKVSQSTMAPTPIL